MASSTTTTTHHPFTTAHFDEHPPSSHHSHPMRFPALSADSPYTMMTGDPNLSYHPHPLSSRPTPATASSPHYPPPTFPHPSQYGVPPMDVPAGHSDHSHSANHWPIFQSTTSHFPYTMLGDTGCRGGNVRHLYPDCQTTSAVDNNNSHLMSNGFMSHQTQCYQQTPQMLPPTLSSAAQPNQPPLWAAPPSVYPGTSAGPPSQAVSERPPSEPSESNQLLGKTLCDLFVDLFYTVLVRDCTLSEAAENGGEEENEKERRLTELQNIFDPDCCSFRGFEGKTLTQGYGLRLEFFDPENHDGFCPSAYTIVNRSALVLPEAEMPTDPQLRLPKPPRIVHLFITGILRGSQGESRHFAHALIMSKSHGRRTVLCDNFIYLNDRIQEEQSQHRKRRGEDIVHQSNFDNPDALSSPSLLRRSSTNYVSESYLKDPNATTTATEVSCGPCGSTEAASSPGPLSTENFEDSLVHHRPHPFHVLNDGQGTYEFAQQVQGMTVAEPDPRDKRHIEEELSRQRSAHPPSNLVQSSDMKGDARDEGVPYSEHHPHPSSLPYRTGGGMGKAPPSRPAGGASQHFRGSHKGSGGFRTGRGGGGSGFSQHRSASSYGQYEQRNSGQYEQRNSGKRQFYPSSARGAAHPSYPQRQQIYQSTSGAGHQHVRDDKTRQKRSFSPTKTFHLSPIKEDLKDDVILLGLTEQVTASVPTSRKGTFKIIEVCRPPRSVGPDENPTPRYGFVTVDSAETLELILKIEKFIIGGRTAIASKLENKLQDEGYKRPPSSAALKVTGGGAFTPSRGDAERGEHSSRGPYRGGGRGRLTYTSGHFDAGRDVQGGSGVPAVEADKWPPPRANSSPRNVTRGQRASHHS